MSVKRKIVCIGAGYVGMAMFRLFSTKYETFIYDPYKTPPKDLENKFIDKEQANKCDVGVVCVPTQSAEDGSGRCDTSLVEQTIDWLETPLIIIKSTVEPSTTDRLKAKTGKRIVFSSEFIGESTYWSPYKFDTDARETPFFIFGGDPQDTDECINLYMSICGPCKSYIKATALGAELGKYMENCFYATKIAFCYEMAEICNKVGASYNEVRELFNLDPRHTPMHTAVFPENDLCFGGKCLVKDLSALVTYSYNNGYESKLLKEVSDSNVRIGKIRAERRNK